MAVLFSHQETSAFVYGAMSFVDKLSNGIAIQLIQVMQPCNEEGKWVLFHCSYISYHKFVLTTHIFKSSSSQKIFCLKCMSHLSTVCLDAATYGQSVSCVHWTVNNLHIIHIISYKQASSALLLFLNGLKFTSNAIWWLKNPFSIWEWKSHLIWRFKQSLSRLLE